MFGFCRFIKVQNSETLICSLSDIWIGKLRLHANMARSDRKNVAAFKPSHSSVKAASMANKTLNNMDTSYVNAAKVSMHSEGRTPCKSSDQAVRIEDILLISLPSNNLTDFPLALLSSYKDFCSIVNTQTLCSNEGFLEVDFKYLGGLWVLFDFSSLDARDKFLNHKGVPIRAWNNDTFHQICKQWGEVLFVDDKDDSNRLTKRLCIKSSHSSLVFASLLVTLKNISYSIRVRELCSWTPNLDCFDSDSEDADSLSSREQDNLPADDNVVDNDALSVADMVDYIGILQPKEVEVQDQVVDTQVQDCDDRCPKKLVERNEFQYDSDPFILEHLINNKRNKVANSNSSVTPEFPPGFPPCSVDEEQVAGSFNNLSDGEPIKHPGFSMINRLEETIKVGLALGLNMEGCENTLASLVDGIGDLPETKMLHVDLWSLLQVWGNPNFDFASSSARVVDGLWVPGNVQARWIVVYAPQNLSCKVALWASLSNLIANWEDILMVMGDFNEVRESDERYGSIFNERQAKFFNEFILEASLIDIPLGVILEKGIPDHRPILLKESENDGLVHPNSIVLFKKKLQNLKQAIRNWNHFQQSHGILPHFDSAGLNSLSSCQLLGISVSDEDISSMANVIGCGAANLLLKYLGVPGCYVTCGRLSLIKSVLGSLPSYFMSIYPMPTTVCNNLESMRNKFFIGGDQEDKKVTWVSWKKCMASRDRGGLGIGSISVSIVYGADGGIQNASNRCSNCTTWCAVLHFISRIKAQGMDLFSLCIRTIGNGVSTWFWEDIWCGNQPLKIQFPRMYMLDKDRNCSVASRVRLVDWSLVLRRVPMGGIETTQFNALKAAIGHVSLSEKKRLLEMVY
ncbi:RNA-directed DNA polymerase, eukaryota, reverse transcriptase zinc-binding domain protein [Tanacetum coccineum]